MQHCTEKILKDFSLYTARNYNDYGDDADNKSFGGVVSWQRWKSEILTRLEQVEPRSMYSGNHKTIGVELKLGFWGNLHFALFHREKLNRGIILQLNKWGRILYFSMALYFMIQPYRFFKCHSLG